MGENIHYLKHYWLIMTSFYSISFFTQYCYFQVVLLEILKVTATIFRMRCGTPSFDKASIKASLKFLLPSVIYAVNNNIYFGISHFETKQRKKTNCYYFSAGLILVPPPIWVILCSFRTVVTTFLYKFILKREVTNLQFLGSYLIVLSIVVAKLGESFQS